MRSPRLMIPLVVFTCMTLLVSAAYAVGSEGAEKEGRTPDIKDIVTLGGTVYYSWWDPVWEESQGIPRRGFLLLPLVGNPLLLQYLYGDRDLKVEPGILLGPLFSTNINERWSFSTNFLVGSYKARSDGIAGINRIDIKATRLDGDFLFAYKTSRWVKLFFGLKYQGFTYDYSTLLLSYKMNYHSFGLAGGIGLTVNLFGDLYFLPNLSVIASTGRNIVNRENDILSEERGPVAVAFGGNAYLPLAYYFSEAHITLAGGARVQYLYYYRKPLNSYAKRNDLFYGINVSVIYSFER